MPIYETADEVYLISFLKPVVSLKMAAWSTWKVFPDISKALKNEIGAKPIASYVSICSVSYFITKLETSNANNAKSMAIHPDI